MLSLLPRFRSSQEGLWDLSEEFSGKSPYMLDRTTLCWGVWGISGLLSPHYWLYYPGGIPDKCASREPGWPHD